MSKTLLGRLENCVLNWNPAFMEIPPRGEASAEGQREERVLKVLRR